MAIRWEPAIYEHKAALIGKSPVETARSSVLLAEAVLQEYEIYRADYLTVGLDVYNIEAEALGAQVVVPDENACPDLVGQLFDLNALPEELALPEIPGGGRFNLLLDAGRTVQNALGAAAAVRVAASGPVTMAAKLAGLENLIISLCLEDGNAVRLLEFTTRLAEKWCACLRENQLEAIVFDSMVAPPMFSPEMYERFILPLHRRLMTLLEKSGQRERELVIGGDTTPIASFLPQTGANILLCDYAADAAEFKKMMGDDAQIQVRRNVNPALLGDRRDAMTAEKLFNDLSLFSHPIAGTGILPYGFTPKNLVDFMRLPIFA